MSVIIQALTNGIQIWDLKGFLTRNHNDGVGQIPCIWVLGPLGLGLYPWVWESL